MLTGKWDDWQGQEEGAEYYEPHADDPDFNVSYTGKIPNFRHLKFCCNGP